MEAARGGSEQPRNDKRMMPSNSFACVEQGLRKPADIIANYAEAGDAGVILHSAAKGTLCVGSHAVCFVEDDELEWRARV